MNRLLEWFYGKEIGHGEKVSELIIELSLAIVKKLNKNPYAVYFAVMVSMKEDNQKILEAAIHAPSGENCQTRRFSVRDVPGAKQKWAKG